MSSAQSCSLQPSRDAASAKADGAGNADHLLRPRSGASASRRRRRRTDRRWRARRRNRPRWASIASSAFSIGDGQIIVSAFDGPASARWRLPPTTKAACATSRRAAGVRPSIPSSPMPTTASQRSLLMEPPTEAPSSAHSRRNVGSERARAADGRRARCRGDSVACGRDRQSRARADPAAYRRLRRRRRPGGVSRTRATSTL